MLTPKGFRFSGVRCGLKNKRNDIGLIVSDRLATAAGVFTQNLVRAACVEYSADAVGGNSLQAIVANSGNANCCTGDQGIRDAGRMAELTAEWLGIDKGKIAVGSTGVIGQPIDMAKVERGINDASERLGDDPRPFMDAILTTDLVEKWAACEVGGEVADPKTRNDRRTAEGPVIFGVAKGSGMIAPNMATMLAFIVTDADVDHIDLKAALRRANEVSFNCMTVDADTSTNDMLIVMANGASGFKPDPLEFEESLAVVCLSLARQVARDGEGATKLIEVVVHGSSDPAKIARTIADSPLVKTAMFGCDPNWGRVLMAAGRAGVSFDPNHVRLAFRIGDDEFELFRDAAPAAFDPKEISTALKSDHVVIDFYAGPGPSATIYTCDFGYGYVRINAEYHT